MINREIAKAQLYPVESRQVVNNTGADIFAPASMKASNIAGRLKSVNVADIRNLVLNSSKNSYQRAKNCTKSSLKLLASSFKVFDGPVSNSALVAKELVALVAKEQQMTKPTAQQWEHAKETYIKLWTKVKPEGKISLTSFSRIGDLTWSQFASGGKIALELSAYYYIGSVIGGTAALPLSLVFRH